MKISIFPLLVALFVLHVQACKKTGTAPSSTTPPAPPTPPAQGNYSGQKLVISQSEVTAAPWAELHPDTVYTSYRSTSTLFKALPTGFDNKLVSVYLPKGFMAVFASNDDGTGETITLVAKDSAVKVNLPARLRNNISYARYMAINNPFKKGTGSTNDTTVQALTDAWYYGWSLNKPSFSGQQFVPMTWGKGSCTEATVEQLVGRNDIDHLLSFNEPDNSNQSNIPVDTAIQRYKIMQKSGLRLGSPAVEQNNAFGAGKWLTDFMSRAEAQQLRIDFVAVHWYDWGNQTNNAITDSLTAERIFGRFVAYMERVRQAYPNHPIWVTEYNANINRSSETVHKYFMKLSAEWMNKTDYVERYAYFFPSTVPAMRADRSLTDAGAYWKTFPSTNALTRNGLGDAKTF